MKKALIASTLLWLFATIHLFAQNFSSSDAVTEWMMSYYHNPQPNFVSAALETLEMEKVLSKKPNTQAPFAGFLSIIFRKSPQQAQVWLKQSDSYAGELKRTIWLGLWLSDTDFSKRYLSEKLKGATGTNLEYLQILTKNNPFNLREIKPNDPGQLDMLWGAFSASGDPLYVKRIISVLPLLDQHNDPIQFAMAASAKWSLKSNAALHPLVLQTCKETLSVSLSTTTDHLAEIISEAEGTLSK